MTQPDVGRQPKCYAHLFESKDGPYLFVRLLGEGAESHAQCVRHVQTKQLRVRKASLDLDLYYYDLTLLFSIHRLVPSEMRYADNETRIVEFIRMLAVPNGCTPRYAELLSYRDEPMATGDPQAPTKWSRVSYWAYYNGGDLGRFKTTWMSEKIEIPRPFIARLIAQLCHTLWYFQSGAVAVFHRDLHTSNIFLHWEDDSRLPDFYIGDLGLSGLSTEVNTEYITMDNHRKRNMSYVLAHAKGLLYRVGDGKVDTFGDVQKVISESGPLEVVFEALEALVGDSQTAGGDILHGLVNVIRLAEHAEKELLESCYINTRAFFNERQTDPKDVLPKYFRGKHQALSSYPVPGPWRLARVDPASGIVIDVDAQVHHRPNQHNCDSASDDDGYHRSRTRRGNSLVFIEGSSGESLAGASDVRSLSSEEPYSPEPFEEVDAP